MSKIVPSFQTLQSAARKALKENFTAYEASKHFKIDRHNMCAYFSGRKPIPLGLIFEILDYIGIQVVCFKRY